MKPKLILCFALMTLALFACSGQKDAGPSGGNAADSGKPSAAAPPAAGAQTHSCMSQGSCREFTFAAGHQAWEVNKTLCSNMGGVWNTGGCPTAKTLATCTKTDGDKVTKMFCYGETMSCQIACQDSGEFKKF